MISTTVSTQVNIELLEKLLLNHPDKHTVEYLVNGLKYGFDTGFKTLPTETYECKNLLSSRKQPDITSQLIQTELDKGFISGPYLSMPFDLYRVNPIGVAEGKYSKKKRLIVDLSAPHNEDQHASLNSLIDKTEF